MSCPLCDEPSGVVESDPVELRVTCDPCGPTFRMTHAVLEEWLRLEQPARAVALLLARDHLRIMGAFMEEPRIQVDDVWAWGRREA